MVKCPECSSKNLNVFKYKVIGFVCECKDCGKLFINREEKE